MTTTAERKHRMSVLSRSGIKAISAHFSELGLDPEFTMMRGPETGLVMLRGRVGGTGDSFNLGEATVTRATVKLADGSVGHAMTLGCDRVKARLCAVIDAMCQSIVVGKMIDAGIIEPLERDLDAADRTRREETAATRVNFFTVVRGED